MNRKYLATLFILSIILVIIWFRHGYMLGGGESALPFYNASHNLYLAAFSWIDYNVGAPNLNLTMAWPFYFLIDKLKLVFGMEFAQAIFILSLITLGLISSFRLIKEFFPSSSNKATLIGSLFYLFNFILI